LYIPNAIKAGEIIIIFLILYTKTFIPDLHFQQSVTGQPVKENAGDFVKRAPSRKS
jgi:hypothetical protein